MRFSLRTTCSALFLFLLASANISYGQLLYEGMVFDGMGKPLLDNASSVTTTTDGKFTYTTSFDDNAVTVYSRDDAGVLTFVETKKNEVDGIVGMTGVYHLKVSPDGNHVYVTGSGDDALIVFARNVVDGTLTYLTTYWNNIDGVEGIEGANYIDIPGDGNHVYVVGPDENAVAVFKRNVLTGTLGFVQLIQDESGDVSEMNYPLSLMVSPNGKHVYVTSYGDNAVNVFSRDLITGELRFEEYHKEGSGGVSGLVTAYAPFVTPDGLQVYVTGSDNNSIVVFNRNVSSGELTYVDTYIDNLNGVDGLSGASTVRVSPDGNYMYVAGANEDAIAIFSRNAETGALTFLSIIQDEVNGVTGMGFPTYLEISEDGNNLYVAAFGSGAIAVFDLETSSGMPTFQNSENGNGLGISGLDGSNAVAISPDGDFVYVAGNNDDAIVAFSRDATSGQLTFVQKIEDSSTSDGLNGINGIVISPDGTTVYATGFWDKSLVVFNRNTTTGMLTYIERYKDGISGVDGLNGVNDITMSSDGRSVYVTGFWDQSLAVFSVNPNGTLSFEEVFKDGQSGVNGLSRASGVAVSPDGKTVYAAGYYDNAISIFNRATDGTLTYNTLVEDGTDNVDGIQRVNSIVVSPDNKQVYATGQNDDAIAMFTRDLTSGELTFLGQMKEGIDDVTGLDGPSRLTMSTDGEHIYVTSGNDDAITAFRRNTSDGTLFFEKTIFDTDENINGLDGAAYVAVTPDGKHMYAAGTVDDAVAIFSCTYIFASDQTICEGDSVVVGSAVYRTSGTYVDTFSFGACKSVSTLKLVVQPAETVMEVEICNGDAYAFNGTTYNATGRYDANLTSVYGCDSLVTLNLNVISEFTNQNIVASICEGETYPWGTGSVSASGNYTENYVTSFGCDSTVNLTLTVHPKYEIALDAEICAGDFYVLGTQNYIATGTFVENFTSINGCDSIVTLNLSVVEPETIMNQTICDGDEFTIGNNTYTEAGTYNFVMTSSAGCDSEVTLNLNVNNSFETLLTAEICQGDTYAIGTNVYSEAGEYTDVFPAVNGCDSTVVLNLVVNATETDLDITVCEGESYTVGTLTFTETGIYPVVLESFSGCGDSTVTLTLTVDPSEVRIPASICAGEAYTLGSTDYTMPGVYTQTITSNAGCAIEYTLELVVNDVYDLTIDETICAGTAYTLGTDDYTESGTYSGLLTASTGCDSMVNVNLTVLTPIEASDVITDATGGANGAIDITVTGGMAPYTFNWSNGATTEDIDGLAIGDFTVEITDANGCVEIYDYSVDQSNSTFDVTTGVDLKIYPNPAPAGGQVNLSFNISEQQTLQIQLYDNVGKLIRSKVVDFLSGNTVHTLEVPQVQGLYQVYIQTENGAFKTIPLSVK